MRKLAWFAFSFSFAVFVSQYFLPLRFMPVAAGACGALGLLAFALLRGNRRRAALLLGLGLASGFLWNFGYDTLIFSGARELDGVETYVTASVVDFPVDQEYRTYVDVKLRREGAVPLKARAYVYDGSAEDLRPGDTVTFTALFSTADTVGETEITSFTSRGYFLFARNARDIRVLSSPGMTFTSFHRYLARAIREKIKGTFPQSASGFMTALLTGDRTELDRDTAASVAMERSGITHIVAVSGMHVAILAGFLFAVLGHSALAAVLAVPVMLVFMAVSGFSPSVVRAVVMQAALLAAPLFYKENDSLTSLSLAMLILLLINPYAVAGVSFQMSFAATLGIILVTPGIQNKLTSRLPKGKSLKKGLALWVSGTFSTTLGALLFTTPISAYYFGSVSLVAPLTNLLVLWAVTPAFIVGAITVGAAFIWLPMGRILAYIPAALVKYILFIAGLCAKPYLSAVFLDSVAMRVWFALTYLSVAAVALLRLPARRLIYVFSASAAALACILVAADLLASPGDGYALTVLDVGQGESVVVTSGKYTAVIDSGSSSGIDAGKATERYVRSQGRGAVDLLVFTHYHEDHAGGAERLFASLGVSVLAVPEPRNDESGLDEEVLAAAERAGCEIIFIDSETVMTLGETVMTLFPPLGSETENERGITVSVSAEGFDTLILGDIPSAQERQLAGKYDLPDVECLVVSHHGSAGSTCGELLDEIRPETAIISVGENSYGHPSPETLERLESRGIKVFRTDESGNIRIETGERNGV